MTHSAEYDVTVTLTAPQVQVLHDVLSMIENDPDWQAMIGGKREMETLYRAHNRILIARQARVIPPEEGDQ